MTRGAIGPYRKRLRASPALLHATVLFRFPLEVSNRPRGHSLSTSPFSKRDRIRAYAAHQQMPAVRDLCGLRGPPCGQYRLNKKDVSKGSVFESEIVMLGTFA